MLTNPATQSRQTSLLDAFGVRTSFKKTTSATSAAQSENDTTAGEDIIDITSSDAEPLARPIPSRPVVPAIPQAQPDGEIESGDEDAEGSIVDEESGEM